MGLLLLLALFFGRIEPAVAVPAAPCGSHDLAARSLGPGGPAAGTFYSSLIVSNEGADCTLSDDLVVSVAGHRAALRATPIPATLLPAGGAVRLFVATPASGDCFLGARGPAQPVTMSAVGGDVPVAGPDLPSFYRCAPVSLSEAAAPSAPSR